MKILAFAGSISSDSVNKKLIEHVVTYFPEDQVEILDLNEYEMPLFSSDAEREIGTHPLAQKFADKIDASDLLIISLAEYNSSYTAAFKNIWDWFSRIKGRKHFGEKPMMVMATAPGPGGGRNVVEMFVTRALLTGSEVLETFILPKYNETFKEGEGIIDNEKKFEIEEKVNLVRHSMKNILGN